MGSGLRLRGWFPAIEIVVLHVLEGILEILGVHCFFHEQELIIGEGIHQDHDPDVVGAYGARGCFVEDGIELAAVISEIVDKFGKRSIHFDTQELLEDALNHGEAGGS